MAVRHVIPATGSSMRPKAHRGRLRLDEDDRRNGKDEVQRPGKSRLDIHPRGRRLQLDPNAETDGGDMSAAAGYQLLGKWRITKADIWDRDYLDLVQPAYIEFGPNGRGEFAFGAMQATME